ncbi:uncharacterized protein EDB91DRAFT_1082573 [Suillus paluster]|uniref:uncharacterized protein n=1 Tax=Suillus paluster TaxID=48578 RepID=UPI001B860461|nr:uncharacterized protein EDB91DRAFT_1082573 [Suillus paluster]KAG1738859.1 hypothetical protein EDB91DRAFT_1082573 [Suillus paluster]
MQASSSTTNTSIDDDFEHQAQVYQELEEYWRGVVEFSATYLRSGFMVVGSFPDDIIPKNLSSPVNGTIILQAWEERKKGRYTMTTFDMSNTLHLIMASAAGCLALKDFDKEGIIYNEGVKVRLESDHDDDAKKKFMVA